MELSILRQVLTCSDSRVYVSSLSLCLKGLGWLGEDPAWILTPLFMGSGSIFDLSEEEYLYSTLQCMTCDGIPGGADAQLQVHAFFHLYNIPFAFQLDKGRFPSLQVLGYPVREMYDGKIDLCFWHRSVTASVLIASASHCIAACTALQHAMSDLVRALHRAQDKARASEWEGEEVPIALDRTGHPSALPRGKCGERVVA